MKKHISKIVIGFLGICIGFAVCYFTGFSPDTRSVVVKIEPNGSLLLSGAQVDSSQLSASLKQQAAHKCIIDFRPSDGFPANKRLVEVMDACKAAGVAQVSIRTPWSLHL